MIDCIHFIHQKPARKEEVGVPLVSADEVVDDLRPYQPYVISVGVETVLPRQTHDTYCHAAARGVLFVPKKGGLSLVEQAFSNPKKHPSFIAGVERSANAAIFKPKIPGELFRWHNMQETKNLWYVALMIGHRFDHGLTFTQISLSETSEQFYLQQHPTSKETGNLRNFVGQLQVLEVANGTLFIGEMTGDFAKPPIIDCQTAADSDNAVWLPDFLGADEAIKQRIEQRLKNMAAVAFSQK